MSNFTNYVNLIYQRLTKKRQNTKKKNQQIIY